MDLGLARTELEKLVNKQAEGTQIGGLQKEQKQGLVGYHRFDCGTIAMLELRCLSDFVARNPIFLNLASKIITSVPSNESASLGNEFVESEAILKKELLDAVGKLKEPITVARLETVRPQENEVLGAYVHQQIAPGLGTVAAIAGIKSSNSPLLFMNKIAENLAKHVAGMSPDSIQTCLEQEYLFDPSKKVSAYLQDSARESHIEQLDLTRTLRISI